MVFINILSTNVRNISKIIIANSFYQIVKSIISFPTSKNANQIKLGPVMEFLIINIFGMGCYVEIQMV
jgi:hypothetical protein